MGTIKRAGLCSKYILLAALFFLVFGTACNRAEGGMWLTDFEEALKQASEEDKFVLLDISASW